MTMSYCSKCGAEATGAFCSYCGTATAQAAGSASATLPFVWITWITVIGLLYFAGTFYAGYQRGAEASEALGRIGLADIIAREGDESNLAGIFAPSDLHAAPPDWERLSPTFAMGVSFGICGAFQCVRTKEP